MIRAKHPFISPIHCTVVLLYCACIVSATTGRLLNVYHLKAGHPLLVIPSRESVAWGHFTKRFARGNDKKRESLNCPALSGWPFSGLTPLFSGVEGVVIYSVSSSSTQIPEEPDSYALTELTTWLVLLIKKEPRRVRSAGYHEKGQGG